MNMAWDYTCPNKKYVGRFVNKLNEDGGVLIDDSPVAGNMSEVLSTMRLPSVTRSFL